MSELRTMQQINEDYTEVCKQIGDLTVKELTLRSAKEDLMKKVESLNEEIGHVMQQLKPISVDVNTMETK